MDLKITGFIRENQFDLNAYLTYLFIKFQEVSQEENKK